MDQMIRTLLSEPPPTAEAVSEARRRLTDEIANARPQRPSRRKWRWSLAGAGAAVAAVVAVGFTVGNTMAPPPVPPLPGPDATAQELLLAAADRAARAEPTVGDGRYWRVQTVKKYGPSNSRGRAGGETFAVGWRYVEETWKPASAGDGTWVGVQHLGFYLPTAQDRAAWERGGAPEEFERFLDPPTGARDDTVSTKPLPGRLESVEAGHRVEAREPFELAQLPSDPDALRAAALDRRRISGYELADDTVLRDTMVELLTLAPAGPELRSAAFTVLSGLPGLRNVGPREDAAGRSGVGIAAGPDARDWFILDPAGGAILGSGDVGGRSPSTTTAVLETGWTDADPVPPAFE